MKLTTRTTAILLGGALAISVAANLFAATAVYTTWKGQDRIEQRRGDQGRDERRRSSRELVAALSPDAQVRVRQSLHDAGMAARPDFQQARELRRQAVEAAAMDPFDRAGVDGLLEQSLAAEVRGRKRLEAATLPILASLEPADRATFAPILNRGKSGGGGRDDQARRTPAR